MRVNRPIAAVAALALVVIATAGVATALAPAASDSPARQIQVSATDEVSAEPDRALLRVGVLATADDAATARDRVAGNVTALRSTLEDLGVPDDRVETAHFDIDEERDREEAGPTRYRAVHAFEITLADTDRVGEVIDGVVDSGANRIQGVSFTLSEERRHDLRQEALEGAMDRARTEADTLAASADLQVGDAASITASDVDVSPYRVEREAMETDDAGASTTIESGAVDVSASVDVVYNATAA